MAAPPDRAPTGPGPITADGCAVDLYLQLPPMGEAEIVHAAVAAGAAVLDLGCGTGRVTHRLIDLGHDVVAVDESAQMLAHVRGAETVCAPIAGLDLGRRFGAVLLASHLMNTPEQSERQALLAAAARHVEAAGRVIVEWHPPEWFECVGTGSGGRVGEVDVELVDVIASGEWLSATVRYRTDTAVWTQPFTARRLTEERLSDELSAAGLRFDDWLTDDRIWFAARPAPS